MNIFEHYQDSYTDQQGALTIPSSIAKNLIKSFIAIPVSIGDLVYFDAYEPHCATQNDSINPRLAFKIVFGEKTKLKEYYKTVEELLQ